MLNFISTDLQLHEIFKITRVSFFGTRTYENRETDNQEGQPLDRTVRNTVIPYEAPLPPPRKGNLSSHVTVVP